MTYNFDDYGWFVSTDNGRATSVEPPSFSETEVEGELRANFTGIPGDEWRLAPYTTPIPPDPQPAVPAAITPRQGRIVLSQYGMLTAMAEYFAGLTGDGADEARIEFEYANEWRRDWPALVAAAASFGLTAEQIDQMFIAAAAL